MSRTDWAIALAWLSYAVTMIGGLMSNPVAHMALYVVGGVCVSATFFLIRDVR